MTNNTIDNDMLVLCAFHIGMRLNQSTFEIDKMSRSFYQDVTQYAELYVTETQEISLTESEFVLRIHNILNAYGVCINV